MKKLFCLLIICCLINEIQAQLVVEVPFDKRITMVFPAKIIDNAAGNSALDPAVNDNKYYLTCVENPPSFEETSLFIELETGHYYDFTVRFNNEAENIVSIYSFEQATGNFKDHFQQQEEKVQQAPQKKLSEHVLNTVSDSSLCSQVISAPATESNIAIINRKILFSLQSIYIQDDKLFLKLYVENQSSVNYDIHSIDFSITTKSKLLKKNAAEAQVIKPVFELNPDSCIKGHLFITPIFVFKKFTISDKKKLVISIWEKGGDRELSLNVSGRDLLNAKRLN